MSNINVLYTDFDPELNMSWDRDVAKATGARAVKNSLLGIITTRRGSRPFDPDFGCDLSDQLFENLNPLVADTIERNIISAVRTHEPRILQLQVDVIPVYDDNAIIVEVRFTILDNPDTLEQLKLQLSNSST